MPSLITRLRQQRQERQASHNNQTLNANSFHPIVIEQSSSGTAAKDTFLLLRAALPSLPLSPTYPSFRPFFLRVILQSHHRT